MLFLDLCLRPPIRRVSFRASITLHGSVNIEKQNTWEKHTHTHTRTSHMHTLYKQRAPVTDDSATDSTCCTYKHLKLNVKTSGPHKVRETKTMAGMLPQQLRKHRCSCHGIDVLSHPDNRSLIWNWRYIWIHRSCPFAAFSDNTSRRTHRFLLQVWKQIRARLHGGAISRLSNSVLEKQTSTFSQEKKRKVEAEEDQALSAD